MSIQQSLNSTMASVGNIASTVADIAISIKKNKKADTTAAEREAGIKQRAEQRQANFNSRLQLSQQRMDLLRAKQETEAKLQNKRLNTINRQTRVDKLEAEARVARAQNDATRLSNNAAEAQSKVDIAKINAESRVQAAQTLAESKLKAANIRAESKAQASQALAESKLKAANIQAESRAQAAQAMANSKIEAANVLAKSNMERDIARREEANRRAEEKRLAKITAKPDISKPTPGEANTPLDKQEVKSNSVFGKEDAVNETTVTTPEVQKKKQSVKKAKEEVKAKETTPKPTKQKFKGGKVLNEKLNYILEKHPDYSIIENPPFGNEHTIALKIPNEIPILIKKKEIIDNPPDKIVDFVSQYYDDMKNDRLSVKPIVICEERHGK